MIDKITHYSVGLVSTINYLEQRLRTGILPGAQAHEPLRAKPVGNIIPKFNHLDPPRPGGVLILFFEEGARVMFPLIKRPNYPGLHGGQISLPGGKSEPNESALQAALREANEEIGIKANEVRVLGTLSPFHVIPSNFMVTPVVAVAKETPSFVPDPREVDRILFASVEDIVHAEAIKVKEIQVANRYSMLAPHFEIDGEVVWGATAMMLNELRQILIEMDEG